MIQEFSKEDMALKEYVDLAVKFQELTAKAKDALAEIITTCPCALGPPGPKTARQGYLDCLESVQG